jgi:hypothetical protein
VDDPNVVIRRTLDEVKAFLAQEHPPKLSEADTKASFVEPLIKALGWEGLGAVTREYYVRNSQEFIDYVLRGRAARSLPSRPRLSKSTWPTSTPPNWFSTAPSRGSSGQP